MTGNMAAFVKSFIVFVLSREIRDPNMGTKFSGLFSFPFFFLNFFTFRV